MNKFNDLILCEKCNQKIYYYCYDCYDKETKELNDILLQNFYSKLYESAQQLKFASRTDTIPVLNAKASSLTFYQKGAWALHVLHEGIGDKAFKICLGERLYRSV